MPFFIGCLAVFFPRFAMLMVWLFGGGYIGAAFEHWIYPLLGFVFLPLTTLAFAFSHNSLGAFGEVPPLGWVILTLAVLVDVGLLGGGGRASRRARL